MSRFVRGVWKHKKSGDEYFALFIARCTESSKEKVCYAQLKHSTLRGTTQVLPYGTKWVREKQDFLNKFELVVAASDDVDEWIHLV